MRHARAHTHTLIHSGVQEPTHTHGAVTQFVVYSPTFPSPPQGAFHPGEGQTFSLNPGLDSSRLAGTAEEHCWAGSALPSQSMGPQESEGQGLGWGAHSWMMGANCVPRSSQ